MNTLDVLFVRDDVAVATTGAWAVEDGAEVDRDRPQRPGVAPLRDALFDTDHAPG